LFAGDPGPDQSYGGFASVDVTPSQPVSRKGSDQPRLTPIYALVLSISCGLVGGYVDVAIIVLKRCFWNGPKNYGHGSDFPWTIPIGHAVLLLIPGIVLATICWIRPRPLSLRAGTWLFATFALWSALLRLPFYSAASLLLASGLAWRLSDSVVALCRRHGQARYAAAGAFGLLVVLAALSSGWRAVREYRAVAGLPAAPSNARNVVLIVWDAVRARNLSLYDYQRNTTPNLVRWARTGVRYNLAIAPASWTYPSHTSFLTGYWPFQLISQWNYSLDAPVPTLAEYLAARGYLTAGFSGNTKICTYETRLDRGFAHFEDYPLTPRSFLSRTVAGSWLLENVLYRDNFYESKWIRVQSRNAADINDSFLGWLGQRPGNRPFFAYLNYFDAHEPYMPPEGYAGRFGINPRLPADFRFLLDYASPGSSTIHERDLVMARDCYDDCIAFLDDQLGQLLERLKGMGLLENTLVIIASDHGEGFYDHGTPLHGNSLFLEEIAVPLVILSPSAPAGRVVDEPVSLRDLPATVVDQLGLTTGSPLPGHSLAACWTAEPGHAAPAISPAFSEFTTKNVFEAQTYPDLRRYGVQMSLVARGKHFTRDGFGSEEIFDLKNDPLERENLIDKAEGKELVGLFRKMLLDELDASPGATEVENTYMKAYRQWLKSLVE
jgi:arylsulfatase A-like enzyme